MSNELEGTWTVETSGGLTQCLFPVRHKIVIQPSNAYPGKLEVVLIDGEANLLMGIIDEDGTGSVTLGLTVRVLDPVSNVLLMRTATQQGLSSAREEVPVGSWTAEEGGGDVEPI